MYLKRLDITGFKTFAGQTEFVFNPGVTAIVGPNGCGKSNVADAIRWVLGEQSVRWLRAKKAEDLIYAGSSGRAPLGMAEVTMTLDNSQGWLAVPFAEVAITRRAYRSGENEYLINRQRVRYRDVSDLLARTGLGAGSYSVVGQGLIDAVLSLKPEERRSLFEDAANIRHYYSKLNDARNKLQQTEQNITRLNDIIAELQPRLTSLESQARQAQQHATIKQELAQLLKVYYLDLWEKATRALRQIEEKAGVYNSLLVERQEGLALVSNRLTQIRQSQSEVRTQLNLWRDRYSRLRAAHDELHRRVAVNRERLEAYRRQSEDLSTEVTALDEQLALERKQLSESEKRLADMTQGREELAIALRHAETKLDQKRRELQTANTRLGALRTDGFQISSSIAELRSRLSHATDRRVTLHAEIIKHRASVQQKQAEVARLEVEARSIADATTGLQDDATKSEADWQDTQRLLSESLVGQQQMGEAIAEMSSQAQELKTRIDLTSKWEHSYSGYFAGVKAVLLASRSGAGAARLSGIVGVVGKLIQATPEVETAIDVALGSHVQDIVVERWEDAETAITMLKRTSGGRATFLPLDTIRRQSRQEQCPRGPGVLGLAAELVRFEPRFQTVASHLLGHTVVVQDLTVARQVLAHCGSGWQIVTLAGEIVRTSGAITGGSTTTTSGILSRQRELRELPIKLAECEVQLNRMRAGLRSEKDRHRTLMDDLVAHENRRRQILATLQSRINRSRELENAIERLRVEGDWTRDQEQQVLREIDEIKKSEVSRQEELKRRIADSEAALEVAEAALASAAELQNEENALSRGLHEARTSLAVTTQRMQSQKENIERLRSSSTSTERRIESKQSRLRELAASTDTLAEEISSAETDLAALGKEMDALKTVMQPAERSMVQMDAENDALVAEENERRSAIQETQLDVARIALGEQKARDDLEALKIRIEADVGPLTFLTDVDESARAVDTDTNELKRRVNSLREQVRRQPAVNPRAVEEFQEAQERHRFLSEQVGDLRQGAMAIHRVIGELQKSMTQRFEETFRAVATEFQRYFTVLFGGGTAKLVLTDPGDISQTGIEILVQPPGKRSQNLSLLSGGERALTAAAILFALLKVNPSPICVLDEVDAALDEANISRFCLTLKDLAKNTQFIVITHNRGTMEMAETLYGISMPEHSISRVVSLRLDGQESREEAHQSQFASAS